jgi:hypothetical protein
MLEVIDDIEILYHLKSELEDVYNNHTGWSFYSPTFFLTAYKEFQFESDKTHLFFIIMREDNKIVSYIPLYIDQKKTLRFIFDEHTDFCGVIGVQPDFNFFKDLSKVILNESKINKISLDNLLPDDSLLNHLKHFLGVGTAITSYNNHSFISSGVSSSFLWHLKSKERSELKRVQNKNADFDFLVFDGDQVFPEEQIKLLRNQMIANKSRTLDFFEDRFLTFSKLLYKGGELEVFTKWNNKQLLSCSLVLKNSKTNFRMVWIDLFADIQFINLSAYVNYIRYLENNQPSVLSFGRGSYDFKTKNFQPLIQNIYNLRFSKSKCDILFSNYYQLKYFLKRIIKNE